MADIKASGRHWILSQVLRRLSRLACLQMSWNSRKHNSSDAQNAEVPKYEGNPLVQVL